MQSALRPNRFDPQRLQRLLDLIGPEQSPGFLDQLDRDLSDCAQALSAAAPGADWPALRDTSHLLISLAGSAGAGALHDQARALNRVAHDQDGARLPALCPALDRELAALIAVVRATRDHPALAVPG
jgi:hypothetical protein